MKFSERYGYKSIREIIQIESIDEPLRNGLWSLLQTHCWDHIRHSTGMRGGYYLSNNEQHQRLCQSLWFNYYKKPLDSLDNNWSKVLGQLRSDFFESEWYEIYDFIEFVANNFDKYQFHERFQESCNRLLEKEMSAYRFVNGKITRITEQHEIDEVEQAIESNIGPVNSHLQRALELLSDRGNPDYRNSIKESISAVESFVSLTVGEEHGTLGQLLKKLESDINLHPALKSAFSKLYGYTSDEGGIRHALTEQDNIEFSDAKFMLVVCSAFINFVEEKIRSAG